MKYNYKVWLDSDDNEKIFGIGPLIILKKIDELGSLNKAALSMNMSYNKAFTTIKKIENKIGLKLLERYKGGASGGGSYITDEAKSLILKYEEFDRRVGETINNIFNEIFN